MAVHIYTLLEEGEGPAQPPPPVDTAAAVIAITAAAGLGEAANTLKLR